MGLPYRNYSQVYKGFQSQGDIRQADWLKKKKDTISKNNPTELPLNAYAGNYVHQVYGKMDIKNENGKLIMRFEHHKGRYGTLEPLGGNRFLCTYSDPLYGVKVLPFTVEKAMVKSVTVTVADFVEFTPYEFVKAK